MDNAQEMSKKIPVCKIVGFSEHHVLVCCPYCGQVHYHGRAGGPGHVLSHCLKKVPEDVGYIIPSFDTYDPEEAENLEIVKKAKRRAARKRYD